MITDMRETCPATTAASVTNMMSWFKISYCAAAETMVVK